MSDFHVIGIECKAELPDGTTQDNLLMCVRDNLIFYRTDSNEEISTARLVGGKILCSPQELMMIAVRNQEVRNG